MQESKPCLETIVMIIVISFDTDIAQKLNTTPLKKIQFVDLVRKIINLLEHTLDNLITALIIWFI